MTFHLISLGLAVPMVHHASLHQLFASSRLYAGCHSARLAQLCSGRGLFLLRPRFLCGIPVPRHAVTSDSWSFIIKAPKDNVSYQVLLPVCCVKKCPFLPPCHSTGQNYAGIYSFIFQLHCMLISDLLSLRCFQHDCLISSSFLPNIFVLDSICLLMENFNLPRDSI